MLRQATKTTSAKRECDVARQGADGLSQSRKLQAKNDRGNMRKSIAARRTVAMYYRNKNIQAVWHRYSEKQASWCRAAKQSSTRNWRATLIDAAETDLHQRPLLRHKRLATQLESERDAAKRFSPTGPGAHWTAREDDKQSGGWMASDVETTSLAIQALVAAKPNSPLILPAVRYG